MGHSLGESLGVSLEGLFEFIVMDLIILIDFEAHWKRLIGNSLGYALRGSFGGVIGFALGVVGVHWG